MIKENSGQVSLEYLLIFSISLMILMIFTLPLAEEAIESTMDISDSLNARSEMSKISQAVKEVYGEGQGSKHSINVNLNKKIKITVTDNHVSCNLNLKSSSNKQINEYFNSNIKKTSLTLNKGPNTLIVEWPMNSKNMVIYRK
ncbi:class III signal peptide-containing protein [Methanobrevibacter sp.]|uniref:class III signal peptide-containing protein n=1 Tax=Methanobrevibacter sp. TaxID=66852 RepID=UPI00386C24D7